MISMQEGWKRYRNQVYPGSLPADQNRELHQAFFAGGLVMMQLMMDTSAKLPEDEAMKAIQIVQDDVVATLRAAGHAAAAGKS